MQGVDQLLRGAPAERRARLGLQLAEGEPVQGEVGLPYNLTTVPYVSLWPSMSKWTVVVPPKKMIGQ